MDLQTQIQLLIDNAPQDGITPQLIVAIAPALSTLAQKLCYLQYYILQDSEQGWVLTTLSNRSNPKLQRRVIYAFPTLQDIPEGDKAPTTGLKVTPILMDVTQILFQLLAMEPVDSIVFLDKPGKNSQGFEVKRSDLQNLVRQLLQSTTSGSQVPPDIA